jgi:hypothetical protein
MKLRDLEWTKDVVKDRGFDWFCKNIDLYVEKGIIEKPSKADVKRAFENITGLKVKTN